MKTGTILVVSLLLIALLWAGDQVWAPFAVGLAALAALGFAFWKRTPQAVASDRLRELTMMCQGDLGLAERLINAEAKRLPGRDRREYIARALDRLTHDRR